MIRKACDVSEFESLPEAEVVLSVGSNCGDRMAQVSSGIDWLETILESTRHSHIYTTGDCHGGKRDYMNAVVIGRTRLSPSELDRLCKEYESDHGRTTEARLLGDVPVDIDVVVYADDLLRSKDFRQQFFQIGYKELFSDRISNDIFEIK